jgi:hypothetical protein
MSRRSPKGAAIIQGVVCLWLVICGTVLGSLLLLNIGGASYCKEKVGFIADQAAYYAASLPASPTRDSKVNTMVGDLLKNMGFSTSSTVVTVSDLTVKSRPAVAVTVSTTASTLLAGQFANVLPGQIGLTYSATSVKNCWFWGYGVAMLGDGQKFTFPLLTPDGSFPADGLPGYQMTLVGMTKQH